MRSATFSEPYVDLARELFQMSHLNGLEAIVVSFLGDPSGKIVAIAL
jgi:hypothetical protein